ncbi:receptor-like protein 9b isoform X1 [Pistacia vera]|uniref:receptor-like protein 9b isoform X1 n=1 Tax=Pistacia vera TaxID=55513 RepID=UPI001263C687|nr:receptor-like protein 9b isoform X1 [Pistacia vera]
MDCKWFWVLLVIMLVSSGEGCWEEERTALLQLKPVFSSKNYLQDWVENSNCCEWERVVCDNITSRVMKLELYDVGDGKVGGWYLNASLFSSFQQLQSLDLSGNNIVGCIENEGFERLSRLSNLEGMNLARNNFNNSILSSLTGFSSLKYLYLFENRFKGAVTVRI